MPTVYNNSYLYFDGNVGILHKELDDYPAPMTEYTISMWFRPHQLPKDLSRTIKLLTVKPAGFECALTRYQQLSCTGDATGDLTVSLEGIRTFNWYIMVLRSKAGQSQMEVREMSYQVVVSQQSKAQFFPPGTSQLRIQRITLGIDDELQQETFIGNLRNFRVFESYLDDIALRKAQYTYLYPIAGLLRVQIMMSDVDDIQSIAGNSLGSVVGPVRNDQPLTKVTDFSPAQICWQPTKAEVDSFKMSLIMFNAKQTFQSQVVQLTSPSATFQAWVYRRYNPNFVNDQILFRHLGFVDLLFSAADPASLSYANIGRGNSGETGGKIPFPYNRWVFVEVTNSQAQFKVSLYYNNGTLLDSRTISTSFALPTRQHTMVIAKDFHGLIQGFKLYSSEAPRQPGPHAFDIGNPASSDQLLFYLFTPDGMSSTGSSFKNQAATGVVGSLALESGTLNFQRNIFVKDYEAPGSLDFGKGDIPALDYWDGVTCIDGKVRLLFGSAKSHGQLSLRIAEPKIDSYTLEMWIYPQSGYQVNAVVETWIAALRAEQQKQVLMALRVERDGSLCCFSSLSADPSRKIKYIDFSPQETRWIHVSCIYDWPNRRARGSLFANNVNYAYYDESQREQSMIQNKDYRLFLNTDPLNLGTKGTSSIAFSEVRLWKQARSLLDIQNSRFHQLNLSVLRPSLLTYLRLYSGSTAFLDFADPTLSKTLLTSGQVSWSPQADLVVCPLGFFKGEQTFNNFNDVEMQCYREGIVKLQVLSYKDTRMGSIVVTPMYSKFRNSYVRDSIEQIYDFEWSLAAIQGSNVTKNSLFRQSLTAQKNGKELIISSELVNDFSGIYDINLRVTDKLKQQDIQQTAYRLRTVQCANLYDKGTGQSLSEVDLDSNKGSQDVVFSYQYTECSNYTLDKSSMTFTIEVDNVALQTADHSPSLQQYNLRTLYQTFLPLNQVFFLKVRALWRNPRSSSDTVETYLIYQCRFISKLILALQPSSLILLKGETLVITHQSSYSNVNQNSIADRSYTVRWQCPETLNQACQAQTSSATLRLDYGKIQNSATKLWSPQTITMVATTNFIQGDGSRESVRSVDIIWLSINPDAKILLLDAEKITKNRNVTVQVDIDGLDEAVSSISWAIEPQINATGCLLNRNDRKQFLINARCLSEGVTYSVISRLIYNPRNYSIWNGTVSFRVPVSPSGGSLSCKPTAPKAYFDKVTCTASNWISNSGQLSYQFFVKTNDALIFAVSSITADPTFQFVLPPAVEVMVKVTDQRGVYSLLSRPLIVTNSASANQTIDEFDRNLRFISFLYIQITDLSLLPQFTWIAQALLSSQRAINNETLFQTNLTSLIDYLSGYTLKQSAKSVTSFTDRVYLAQVALQVLAQATLVPMSKATAYRQAMQTILGLYTNRTDVMNALMDEPMNGKKMALQVISQCMAGAQRLRNEIIKLDDGEEKERERMEIGETFRIARQMIIRTEEFISSGLKESESVRFNLPEFNISIEKYSRIDSENFQDLSFVQNPSFAQSFKYKFPFSKAIQPTERQSLSVISFNVNPFIESNFTNQTATSQHALLFVYRDRNGKYLSSSSIPNAKVNMTFPYKFSPFIFLPNVAACAAMTPGARNWEKKYCNTTYDRDRGIIACSCQHLSFYSIIEDYLEKPTKYPVVLLTFKNWVSFIAIIYVFLVFIIGVIFSYNKDNQDFRYLHEQDDLEGNEMEYDEQISLVQLAFKRKVFFMDFSEENSMVNLFRLYLLVLHPVLQVNYRLDPHTPRFHRFLLLFSRLNLSFLLSFFQLRHLPNPSGLDSSPLGPLFAFIFLGSLLFAPLPSILFAPFRSRYYLLKKDKGDIGVQEQRKGVEIDAEGNGYRESDDNQNEVDARISNVEIDASIPIKLIFLLNAIPIDKIVKEQGKVGYCRGSPREVGEKLLELDQEWVAQKNDEKKSKTVAERAQPVLQTTNAPINITQLTRIENQRQTPQIIIEPDNGPGADKLHQTPLKFATRQDPGNSIFKDAEEDISTPRIATEGLIAQNIASMISPRQYVEQKEEFNNENMDDQDNQENPSASNKNLHVANIRSKDHYEGGDRETPQDRQPENQGQSEEGNESEISIDTNLFTDERKEIIEMSRFQNRALGFLLVFGLNACIMIAVLNQYVKEDFQNKENPYIWVLSFFVSQFVGLFIMNPLCLLLCALVTSRWLRFNKVFLARFFTDSLYIFEDYQFAVQFANTKIS